MSILITFIPWFCYWVFLSCGKLEAAAFGGLICAVVVSTQGIIRRNVKVLQLGTLIFFLILAVITTITEPAWLWRWVSLMGNGALALIVLVSIIIGKPFTLQYARENVPRSYWHTPQFLRTNYVITWVWFAAFIVMMIPSVLRLFGMELKLWVNWVISTCCFVAAIKFTYWYRKRQKSNKVVPPGGEGNNSAH